MKPTFLALGLLAGVGCVHYEPTGPFAKQMGGGNSPTRPSANVKVMPARDAGSAPMLPAAPPPAPPSVLVTPGDVNEANSELATKRLLDELDADRKAMDQMPRYSEVSVVKSK